MEDNILPVIFQLSLNKIIPKPSLCKFWYELLQPFNLYAAKYIDTEIITLCIYLCLDVDVNTIDFLTNSFKVYPLLLAVLAL